jgi:archaetidylinositol phosphate synthase
MAISFVESTRQQDSLLSGLERRALHWLAARTPRRVTSDHLTLLGFVSLLSCGVCYALSSFDPRWLLVVNACLLLNWFGDSLDGTLARYRNHQRPRYGFYVDHIVDATGSFVLVLGLGLSPYMSVPVAAMVLIAYFLLSINSFLATYTLGDFRISFCRLSPTEIRLLLIIGNLVLLVHPRAHLAGGDYLLFDVAGLVAAAVMTALFAQAAISNTRRLYKLEPPRRSA